MAFRGLQGRAQGTQVGPSTSDIDFILPGTMNNLGDYNYNLDLNKDDFNASKKSILGIDNLSLAYQIHKSNIDNQTTAINAQSNKINEWYNKGWSALVEDIHENGKK